MRPFTVPRPEAEIEQLRARIRQYRFPPAPEAAGWRYRCDPNYLRALCACWVERGYDVVRWAELPQGGHFVAMEVPELFVEDLRGWARDCWQA